MNVEFSRQCVKVGELALVSLDISIHYYREHGYFTCVLVQGADRSTFDFVQDYANLHGHHRRYGDSEGWNISQIQFREWGMHDPYSVGLCRRAMLVAWINHHRAIIGE